jgi:hypothetical protein
LAVSEDLRTERRLVLQGLLEVCGLDPPSGVALNGLLAKCPDVDLAFTALTMEPRPAWVQEIVGPLSMARSARA